MAKPNMQDVAAAAGVGVATVDRVINKRAPVQPDTAQRVLEAAHRLGFRRAGLIESRVAEQQRPLKFGFLLQNQRSPFYKELGKALRDSVQAMEQPRASATVVFMDDLTPRKVAERLLAMAESVDAIALVAADHPVITQAIDSLQRRGVPVFALVSELSAPHIAGYVGIDNRKMGRSAAWAMAKLCKQPGKVGLLLGSHRYLCQEQCEVSFRSYLRETAQDFQVLETLVSLEDTALAEAATMELLHSHPDLVGVYVAGGGIEGVLDALRQAAPQGLVTICHDLTDITRQALLDGHADVVLSHPREWMARRLCEAMATALGGSAQERVQGILPFTTYTVANV